MLMIIKMDDDSWEDYLELLSKTASMTAYVDIPIDKLGEYLNDGVKCDVKLAVKNEFSTSDKLANDMVTVIGYISDS